MGGHRRTQRRRRHLRGPAASGPRVRIGRGRYTTCLRNRASRASRSGDPDRDVRGGQEMKPRW
ncbi:DUF2749 domain-containing protein [Brucella intermedia]|uniref:DUF2749 domain-containing protein n=1 Tax=Brucella intermedia TaxID=94625 RepID=UPI003CE5856F